MNPIVALAFSPNQMKFAEALVRGSYQGAKVLAFGGAADFQIHLESLLRQTGDPVVLMPHAPASAAYEFIDMFLDRGGRIGALHKFYEGAGSYTHTAGGIVAKNKSVWEKRKDYTPLWDMDFIGVAEFDKFFKRKTRYTSLNIDDVFSFVDEDEVPEELGRANVIYLGQPILENGYCTGEEFKKFMIDLAGVGVDTYIAHPREGDHSALMPDGVKVLRLPHPVEEYRAVLKGRKVLSLFSTSVYALAAAGAEVALVEDMPPGLEEHPECGESVRMIRRIFREHMG